MDAPVRNVSPLSLPSSPSDLAALIFMIVKSAHATRRLKLFHIQRKLVHVPAERLFPSRAYAFGADKIKPISTICDALSRVLN